MKNENVTELENKFSELENKCAALLAENDLLRGDMESMRVDANCRANTAWENDMTGQVNRHAEAVSAASAAAADRNRRREQAAARRQLLIQHLILMVSLWICAAVAFAAISEVFRLTGILGYCDRIAVLMAGICAGRIIQAARK